MLNEPNSGLAPLILAKLVCCGGVVLVATGALSGVGTWLFDRPVISLAPVALALMAGVLFWWYRGHTSRVKTKPQARSG